MKLIFAVLALSLSASALAQTSAGVQGGAFVSGFGTRPEGGVHIMTTRTSAVEVLGTNRYRVSMEGNLAAGAGGPNLLLDASLLWPSGGGSYVGAGLGSGVGFPRNGDSGLPFPAFVLTPLALANLHGVYGVRLDSGMTVEGMVRLKPASEGGSVTARISFPLR
ncbi:hypothetical protein [Deinococcus deserti]|uniref:Uncharacterized protein n=1 Tax=Deinococcus deserti (strain DSM 17065 / CIP 109153 / LMG 22923 / VCD115) TaxID=546414 RepID=X5GY83_DEIDV|nr:hypothetical protein [Deinococcus deserti]AHX26559.1 hypothetical protein, precursor [Deinococcus deserti VCD115]